MDAGLNQSAGIFVRNFYLPILQPDCSERRLLKVSKLCTGVFGAIIITVAIIVSQYRTLGLFDLLNQLGVSFLLPISVPLFLGLYYKRTPSWSTWTTVCIGLALALGVNRWLSPESFAWMPGFHGPYTKEEGTLFQLFATVTVTGLGCTGWFYFTSLFYERSPAEYKASVEEFFERLKRPVLAATGAEKEREDAAIAGSIGKLCMIYGGFIVLLMFIPNTLTGRLCFLCCGGVMLGCGVFLSTFRRGRRALVLSGNGNHSLTSDPK